MDDYESLLDNAYKGLPEKAKEKARFEYPTADTFQQGNQTIIRNFDAIAQKLRREPAVLSKYLSKELAVPASIEGQRLILYGKFNNRFVNEKLKDFIKRYVICPECGKPDTKLVEYERGIKLLVCEACGARGTAR